MDFDISDLPAKFISGLQELHDSYKFSTNGTIKLTAVRGETSILHNADGFCISYSRECEFYREFVKLVCGETQCREHCVFEDMAVMVDCSRNAVINTDSVKKLIRLCSCMGYGTLMLYTEDTYAIDKEPFFGYMRGRYAKAELKELDAYGKIFGVELVPCVQTLAHLNGIIRWDRFKPIIDCNDILLAGDERTYELIDEMFNSLTECFTSRRVHIGMDEAHMVGLGKYLDAHGYENRYDILLRHLRRVLEIAQKHGFSCIMWSDMFFRLANGGKYEPMDAATKYVCDKIPECLTLMYWDYYRNDVEYYDKMFAAHKELCKNVSFACGAWRWNGFTPSVTMSANRNKLAFDECIKHEIDSVTVTMWGDDGGECSTFSLLPTLVASAEYAYGNRDCKKAFKRITGVEFDDFSVTELAERVTDNAGKFYGGNVTKVFLYNDLLCGLYDYAAKPEYKQKFADAAKRNRAAARRAKKYGYIFRTVAALCELVGSKYDFGMRARSAYARKDMAELKALADEIPTLVRLLDKFYKAFGEQWNIENKPFGFEIQDLRIGGLKQRMLHCRDILCDYTVGKTNEIAELETEILPTKELCDDAELRTNCRWQDIITVNRI
ncbi:MAG: beta-N-acetylhexosaminidase [Clostridiales bacterium]|nr:beta-N-acetylhexosaminidase [Clostridiales bacterium]